MVPWWYGDKISYENMVWSQPESWLVGRPDPLHVSLIWSPLPEQHRHNQSLDDDIADDYDVQEGCCTKHRPQVWVRQVEERPTILETGLYRCAHQPPDHHSKHLQMYLWSAPEPGLIRQEPRLHGKVGGRKGFATRTWQVRVRGLQHSIDWEGLPISNVEDGEVWQFCS